MRKCEWSPELVARLKCIIKERRKSLSKSLCGCKVHDIPIHVQNKMKEMRFQMTADYFFRKEGKRTLRAYFTRDISGNISYLTLYLPIRFENDDECSQWIVNLKKYEGIETEKRGYWLDLYVTMDVRDDIENIDSVSSPFESHVEEGIHGLLNIYQRVREENEN